MLQEARLIVNETPHFFVFAPYSEKAAGPDWLRNIRAASKLNCLLYVKGTFPRCC
jgi:hypothetical protein